MQWMVLETQFRVVPGRNYQEGRATIRHYSSQPYYLPHRGVNASLA